MESEEERSPALEHLTLFVRGLHVEARVGVHNHERGQTQPLIVDLEIRVPLPDQDDISATLDYVHVANTVRRIAMSRHFELVESFVHSLGSQISCVDKVRRIFIRVTKPSALAGSANATGVELLME
ncbi:dihydroneopterin aldolase [Bradyrhizobium pachyrhizi]|uniref:dihydroneopterin aldolase n=1 Tax=Bradyrhizobium pachyrhizi TaxID=280333 RepID=UPI00067DA63D|nr:dihydroneopterin aldolase [Bradyrhizobium pachyrhizi]